MQEGETPHADQALGAPHAPRAPPDLGMEGSEAVVAAEGGDQSGVEPEPLEGESEVVDEPEPLENGRLPGLERGKSSVHLTIPDSQPDPELSGSEPEPELPDSQPELPSFPWDEEESEYDKFTAEDKALPLHPQPKSKSKGWVDNTPEPEPAPKTGLQLKLAMKALAKLKKQQDELMLCCE